MSEAFGLILENGPDGRLLGKTERTPNREFTYAYEYDDAGRLTKVLRDGMLSEMYVYDNEGRRWSETNAFRRLYDRRMRYGAGNRLLACGPAGYVHGDTGFREVRQSPDGETHYYYAGDGRMLGADLPGGRQIAFRHDQADRRVRKLVNGATVEEYEWLDRIRLGAAIIEGLPMQFHYEQGRVPVAATIGNELVFLHYDQVGSLRVVADRYGNVIQEIVYDSFGNVLENTNPGLRIPIGFAGGLYDPDTGLVRFGFRDYDPDTGRFTALDPIGPLGGDPDEYGYCLDDPVNGIDPVGLESNATDQYWSFDGNDLSHHEGNSTESWPAVSGPHGNGRAPEGNYTMGDITSVEDVPENNSFCDSERNCWWRPVTPDVDNDRDSLGIHPDGGTAGTAGCVGATQSDTSDLYEKLRDSNATRLEVDYPE